MLGFIGLILSFLLIILLISRGRSFGLSLLIGSIPVFVFSAFERDPLIMAKEILAELIYSIDDGTIDLSMIKLTLVVLMITIIARSMEITGMLEEILRGLRSSFSRRSLFAIIPATLGLLHVPGGAIFSAPMIGIEGKRVRVSKEDLAFYNIWFRHIWFLVSPLSSSLILICSEDFAGINIYSLILYQIPIFIFMILIGMTRIRGIEGSEKERKTKTRWLRFLLPIVTPILISIILTLLFGVESITSLLISVPVGILSVLALKRSGLREGAKLIARSISWKLPFAVVGILTFRAVVLSSDVIEFLSGFFSSNCLHPLLIIIPLPFLLSILMGHNLGSIALAYPVVEPLLRTIGGDAIALTSIFYVSSFSGYLFSPLHLCVAVTNEYFKVNAMKFYQKIIPPSILLIPINLGIMLAISGLIS
ncbi:MAG TPA: DUF401 family protein [Thermoplasmatales archaeon]|nr:DUF401 family protein [Thermoplasmatales archaeon]HEX17703.1 DUF401 family protein [Thermoplasmatales archaeon]